MSGFLTFAVIAAGVVWLLWVWRKREMEKFREGDMRALRELTGDKGLPETTQPPKAPKGSTPDVSPVAGSGSPAPAPEAVPGTPAPTSMPAPTGAALKAAALDEIHASILPRVEEIVGNEYRVFPRKPLADVVRLDRGEVFGREVSFLVCERATFRPVVAIALKGAGPGEAAKFDYLGQVCREVGLPFAGFPLMANLSIKELEEGIRPLLAPSPRPPGRG